MLHDKLLRLWVLVTLLLVGSLIGASVGSAVHAAGVKSTAQDNIVISEFRPRGPNGTQDDFVEIFNPSVNTTIDIGGWSIRRINNTGQEVKLYTFIAGQKLEPGQHFLVAAAPVIDGITSDATFSSGNIPDGGGVFLKLADGKIVDKVGMSTLGAEGTPLGPLSDPNHSYERKPGGNAGSCYDSNNNAFNFAIITSSNPQNLDSHLTVCGAATVDPSITPSDTGTPTDAPISTQTGTDTFTPTVSDTPTSSQTFTVTLTPTVSNTPTNTPTITLSSTPSAPVHVVISEFRTLGTNGADDEFVELYNPTGAAVNIGGWVIKRSTSCGTSTYNLVSITGGTILQAGQHFLAATTASNIPSPDQTFSPGLADDGGLALIDTSGMVVDQIGMCISTLFREGTNLSPLTRDADQSYERRTGGSTSCYDLNNNAVDFALISPSTPLNMVSPIVMCAGVADYTPTRTPSRTPTRTPTKTRTPTRTATTLPGSVVINEFLPHPHIDWNGDGIANTGDEYIELINMGTASISLKKWKLDNGFGGPGTPYTLPDVTLLPRQIVHFYHSESGIGLSDGGGTVRLLKPDGRTADIYNYPLVEAIDQTWCRLPDGKGAWAFACFPTPGKMNERLASGTPAPGSTPEAGGAETDPFCLADTAPQAVLSAECDSPGTKMWGDTGYREFWLESQRKWPVFVE